MPKTGRSLQNSMKWDEDTWFSFSGAVTKSVQTGVRLTGYMLSVGVTVACRSEKLKV